MNSIATEAFATMESHLTEVTVELFASYGMQIARCERQQSSPLDVGEHSVVAFMGYAGDKVRGALVLVASRPAIQTWLVALGEADPNVDVCDTLGEFSNMLLGRLKGRLLPAGFPILLSTPTTASGSGLRLSRPVRPSSVFSFLGKDWGLDIRIDATFEDGFALQLADERTDAAAAGDMMLF
jgi:CheY-specific phosphatase CheX